MSVDLLAAFLKTVGAFETRHSGRTLGEHLLGTYALLADAGCDEETCLAGGLHSIYGTARFRTPICDREEDGWRVSWLFGESEDLVALFSVMLTAEIEEELGFEDDDRVLARVALIAAANILEQGGNLDRWPRIRAVWEQQRGENDD